MKVLICHHHRFELWCAPAWIGEHLARAFSELQVVYLPDYARLAEEIPDTDILIGSFLKPEHFAIARKLKWIHSPAAAVHQLMFTALIDSNVIVTNAGNVHGPVVAEHGIALVLALAKRLSQAMQYQYKREWAQSKLWEERPRPREIAGATAVVIGMGSIGREFAARAKALGMRVLAVREDPSKGPEGADAVYGSGELDGVLPQADYVLLCTPVTPATTGLINEHRLALMKPDAYLVNLARGPLVDESALIKALEHEKIAGAALDVFNQEPLPPDSPLWNLKNVLITPHTAAVTERLWQRHYRLIEENMRRFLDGRTLANLIDKRRRY
jgi:phosphoglycerate dehydrogenase-like enzyme